MINQIDANHPQNTHNSAEVSQDASSVDYVDGSAQVKKLLAQLRSMGVVLSIDADGKLAFDGPADVLTAALLAKMKAQRDGLRALIEQEEERLAIVEFDGGPSRVEPVVVESAYLEPMCGVLCPWCRSDAHLVEIRSGLRCDNCGRKAWRFEGDGAIVRADWYSGYATARVAPDKPAPIPAAVAFQSMGSVHSTDGS